MNRLLHVLELNLGPVLNALGWTLIHALWQGFLLGLIAALALIAFRKHPPATRYSILVSSLLALPAISGFTFMIYLKAPQETFGPAQWDTVGPAAATSNASFALESYFPQLVALWLLGMVFLSLRVISGYVYSRRLIRRDLVETDPLWPATLRRLSDAMGLSRKVALVVSRAVDVPMVIGHFKPVVLLPLSVLSGLPRAEVEAVLLHELGHIKRNDYLLNMTQTILETMFFFHPAVWWLSSRLREERECCCDDLAVAVSEDPLTFARALAHLQEVHMQTPIGAVAATGQGALFSRIKRLMGVSEYPKPFDMAGAALALLCGLVLFISCVGTLQATEMNQDPQVKPTPPIALAPPVPRAPAVVMTQTEPTPPSAVPTEPSPRAVREPKPMAQAAPAPPASPEPKHAPQPVSRPTPQAPIALPTPQEPELEAVEEAGKGKREASEMLRQAKQEAKVLREMRRKLEKVAREEKRAFGRLQAEAGKDRDKALELQKRKEQLQASFDKRKALLDIQERKVIDLKLAAEDLGRSRQEAREQAREAKQSAAEQREHLKKAREHKREERARAHELEKHSRLSKRELQKQNEKLKRGLEELRAAKLSALEELEQARETNARLKRALEDRRKAEANQDQ